MTLAFILVLSYKRYANIHELFVYNPVTANFGIFQFIILGNKGSHRFQIEDINITLFAKLPGITTGSKLNFLEHINNTIQKVHYDLYALRRLRNLSPLEIAKPLQLSCLRITLSLVH